MLQRSPQTVSHPLMYLLTVLAVVAGGFFASAPAVCDEAEAAAAVADGELYGESLKLDEAVLIEAILADPEAYAGKRVRVEGRVREVCPKKGCWMDLVPAEVSEGGEAALRIKVEDDVIVFPGDAVGSVAVAEGVVEVVEMERQRYVAWLAHQAEERGEDFDPSTVGEGPFQWVQVKGEGARLSRR